MLAAPLNGAILRALQDGPKQQADLRRESGHPAQTTLRAQLKKFCDAGVIEKRRRNRFPGVLEYELSEAGHGLSPVSAILERWLRDSPDGALELGGSAARAAVKALTDGWSTAILRALAVKPLTLTELDRVTPGLNYPSVERRLAAMRLTSLVKALESEGRGTPYSVTDWARRATAALVAATRWERRQASQPTSTFGRTEIETIFLLAAPLLNVPNSLSGTCRIAVELSAAGDRRLAGTVVAIDEGRPRSCTHRLDGEVDAWALGSATGWLELMAQGDLDGLELGGDSLLSRAVLDALHHALLGSLNDPIAN
jgi:DNA-binding HxlR family transcriptional regulator